MASASSLVVPALYGPYVEAVLARAKREIEQGELPRFMQDDHAAGKLVICVLHVEEASPCLTA